MACTGVSVIGIYISEQECAKVPSTVPVETSACEETSLPSSKPASMTGWATVE